ncbi:hypothetical protein XavaCFBP5823_17065 [Xanthomonas axonopodis pv. vasculorum]|nr:hypothetical protein XavaCFBP5823_17065 [Xanthomonas axonopodis pv. vasculorum]
MLSCMVSSPCLQPAVTALAFNKAASQLSVAVSSPIVGPLAAWMLPSSLQGWIHGVSRER